MLISWVAYGWFSVHHSSPTTTHPPKPLQKPKDNMTDYPTPETPFQTIGLREICTVNNHHFKRLKGTTEWTEYTPPTPTTDTSTHQEKEDDNLYLSLAHITNPLRANPLGPLRLPRKHPGPRLPSHRRRRVHGLRPLTFPRRHHAVRRLRDAVPACCAYGGGAGEGCGGGCEE